MIRIMLAALMFTGLFTSQVAAQGFTGTLKQIKAGLEAVDEAIEQYNGHTVWHTGDRMLAEFPDAKSAMQAALKIQGQISSGKRKAQGQSIFRIGVCLPCCGIHNQFSETLIFLSVGLDPLLGTFLALGVITNPIPS